MVPGIDPTVDYAFKKLFGSEANKSVLICLLNAVLTRPPGREIASVDILNPFNDKESLDDKLSILDIKARDQLGRQYNIEMQIAAGQDFPPRILYYWAKLHSDQLAAGDNYHELHETISICFVSNNLFPKVPDFHQEFKLRSSRNPEVIFNEQISIHLIELAKFEKGTEELTDPMDRWCYFLVHGRSLDSEDMPKALKDSEFEKAMEVMKMLTQDEIEHYRYEDRLKAQRDHNSMVQWLAMTKEEIAKANEEIAKANEKIAKADEKSAKADEKIAKADEKYAKADEKFAKAEKALAMLDNAVEEAAKKGVEQGRADERTKSLVSLIQVYEQLLKLPATSHQELLAEDMAELQTRVTALERQLGINRS